MAAGDQGGHMSMCWVQAGICGEETSIEASKAGPSAIALAFTTTCEHIAAFAEELRAVDAGVELSRPMNETLTYTIAAKHCCRTSCVVPAAVLKSVEATAGVFLPASCTVEFIDGAL
jgi:hypothetical protein